MKKIVTTITLILSLLTLVGCNTTNQSLPAAEFTKTTYVYKTVGETQIKADVYRTPSQTPQPVLVWIHGGALIMGSRKNYIPAELKDLCRTQGYILISLDYRRAPETKLPEIITDIQQAFTWIRQKGPDLFGANPDKIVVAGASAGGYLTLMTGICVQPKPNALVSYWGYGDIDGKWYNTPSKHHGKGINIPEEQLFEDGKLKHRSQYYLWLRAKGVWTKNVTGFDPETDRDKLTPYCPVRNVTSDYPPTCLVHGTEDKDVPYEKSTDMAEQFARNNVPYLLLTVPNAGHGLGNVDKNLKESIRSQAKNFIKQYLK